MYSLLEVKKKGKVKPKKSIKELSGFMMTSKKGFTICEVLIKDLEIMNKNLANGVVTKQVLKKYNKLIPLLTELLISDDDSGDSFREALNHIEKFRLEIKNKYREFLKRKELEMMSKQLTLLKKEADRRMLETVIKNYNGGPVGLDTLAATIGEESDTIEDVYEPYLMQIGFINRTPRGRMVTRLAYEHFGIPFGQKESTENISMFEEE